MKTRTLLLVLPLAVGLAGCGGGAKSSLSTSPSPGSCTPTGTGTTDLTKKPVVPAAKGPAPVETTTYDVVCGTGALAKNGSKVEVKYVGVLYQGGAEFDSSWSRGADQTLAFTVGSGVIPGFSKGADGMRVGGRREVVIPAKDGYGDQGAGPIPPGATLIFVLDLVKVG